MIEKLWYWALLGITDDGMDETDGNRLHTSVPTGFTALSLSLLRYGLK